MAYRRHRFPIIRSKKNTSVLINFRDKFLKFLKFVLLAIFSDRRVVAFLTLFFCFTVILQLPVGLSLIIILVIYHIYRSLFISNFPTPTRPRCKVHYVSPHSLALKELGWGRKRVFCYEGYE